MKLVTPAPLFMSGLHTWSPLDLSGTGRCRAGRTSCVKLVKRKSIAAPVSFLSRSEGRAVEEEEEEEDKLCSEVKDPEVAAPLTKIQIKILFEQHKNSSFTLEVLDLLPNGLQSGSLILSM